MKLPIISLSLFSLSSLIPLFGAYTPAMAGCVMTDVATQVAIHGSRQPAQQNNNVNMQSDQNCLGNVTTSTGTQVYIGSDNVQQTRNSNHYVGGSNNQGLKTPVIGVPVQVQVDVYSPAHDQEFLNQVMP